MSTPVAAELSFEDAMQRLEEIVQELDRGDLALEDALALFQEGSALREACERKLAEAEATVEQLVERASAAPPADGEAAADGDNPPAESLFADDDE